MHADHTWAIYGPALAELETLDRSLRTDPTALATLQPGPAGADSTTANGVATIHVRGVLTPQPSRLATLFGGGGTSYAGLREALARADSDPSVTSIVLAVDSPGGTVGGLFETVDAIRGLRTPTRAHVTRALSAGYVLAAATGRIEATGRASEVGSVGVAAPTRYFLDGEQVIDITSTEAPKKRPDVRTEAGRAVVREHLDAVHGLLAEAIARGRRTTAAVVDAHYGRGAVLLADAAIRAGMIDSIVGGAGAASTGAQAQAADQGDLGDAVAAELERRRGRGGRPSAQASRSSTAAAVTKPNAATQDHAPHGDAAPAIYDLGDQVAAQLEARRAGRPAPDWACQPLGGQQHPHAQEATAGDEQPEQEAAEPAPPTTTTEGPLQQARELAQTIRAMRAGR